MAVLMRTCVMAGLGELRHEPTTKRIRALVGGETVLDTTAAELVWEPRRLVPSYAVPVGDIRGTTVPVESADQAGDDAGVPLPSLSERPVLDPSVPFAAHTTPGTAVDVRVDGSTRRCAGLVPDDPDLAGYVVLDFRGFDEWYEEDERNVAHPRDPFKRIDVLTSSRSVRVSVDGTVLAESGRPRILYETYLPPRFYLPRQDVRVELLPSATRTVCAYKGQAAYWSPLLDGGPIPDLAWSFEEPLDDATRVQGMVAFFNERVDVEIDGAPLERPVTPWSART